MRKSRSHLLLLIAGAAACGGCAAASWTPHFIAGSRKAESIALAEDDQDAALVDIESAGLAKAEAVAHPMSSEKAYESVRDELLAIRELDPDMEREVVETLKTAKPDDYHLIVHQYHAALSYRQQLAMRDSERAARLKEMAAEDEPQMARNREPNDSGVAAAQYHLGSRVAASVRRGEQSPALDDPGVTMASDDAPRRQDGEVESLPPPPTKLSTRLSSYSAPSPKVQGAQVVHATHLEPQSAYLRSGDRPSGDWRAELETTIQDLQSHVAAAPASVDDVHDHMRLRTLQLLAGRTDDALAPIPGANPAQQEYWSKQLFAMSSFLDSAAGDERTRAAAALAHLGEARDRLAEIAALQVKNATFVTRVDGYGLYEAAKDAKFTPGQSVTVYAEIDNFRSRSTPKGYETALGTSYQVVDPTGRRVDGAQFPDVQDACQSRRHDFHMQYELELPTRIYPGAYTLQVIVTDHQSNKIGQAELPFEIVEGAGK